MTHDGYIASDALIADSTEFGFEPIGEGVEVVRPRAEFWDAVPKPARDAFQAFVARVEDGTFPDGIGFYVHMGFDFAENECDVLDPDSDEDVSGDVFTLASDGAGNFFCLHRTGEVVVWNHEERFIEDHNHFASLDEVVWALIRYQAAMDETVPAADVVAMFEWADDESGVGWLREMVEDEL